MKVTFAYVRTKQIMYQIVDLMKLFSVRVNFCNFHSVFRQKLRESNVFTKEVTKELFSRNYFLVRKNLCFSTLCVKHSAGKIKLHTLFAKTS